MSKVFRNHVLYINGIPVAHMGPGGQATAPEECWVTIAGQKVKQKFMNLVHSQDLKATTSQIFVTGYPIATLSSLLGKSYGDEGSDGGVKSCTKLGTGRFLTASHNVRLEGSPAVRHGDKMLLNNDNSEITTWCQPMCSTTANATILSDPIETLADPQSLNIELVRSPQARFEPVSIQQSIRITHRETQHTTYQSFAVFKHIDQAFLWHGDTYREGTYDIHEFYTHTNKVHYVPLGTIHSGSRDDTKPSMKLLPLSFKRYDDMQKSGDGAKNLYTDTFVYLFKNGYLWRVLYVNRLGQLCEMDFSKPYKKIDRSPSPQLNQGVLLPIEDANGKHEFHYAVSSLALSWEILHQLGGFDPADTRFTAQDRLAIAPNPALIKLRLKKIEIDAFLTNGEAFTPIPTDQTEDTLISVHQEDEPTDFNWEWVADKIRINPSTGTKRYAHDLSWHNNLPVLDLGIINELDHAYGPVDGGAQLYIDDPMGRMIFTADFIMNRHYVSQSFLDENAKVYGLGDIVGKMLEHVRHQGHSYSEFVRESERFQFMRKYAQTKVSHQAFVRRAQILLKYWMEQTDLSGQWQDIYLELKDADSLKEHRQYYERTFNNVNAALLLSADGQAYLQNDLNNPNGRLTQHQKFVERVAQYDPLANFTGGMMEILASSVESSQEGLDRIAKFYQEITGTAPPIKLIPVSLDTVIEHHREQMLGARTPATAFLGVQSGVLTRTTAAAQRTATGKTIMMVAINERPIYEWYRLMPGEHSPISTAYYEKMKAWSDSVKNMPHSRFLLSSLSIFGACSMQKQIRALELSGELDTTTHRLLNAETIKYGMLAAYFGAEGMLRTKAAVQGKLSRIAGIFSNSLNIGGVMLGTILDGVYSAKALSEMELALASAHAIGVVGGVTGLIHIFKTMMKQPAAKAGYVSLALMLLSSALVALFRKNEIQKWLSDGYWGTASGEKRDIDESMEQYYFLTQAVSIDKIDVRDIENTLLPSHTSTIPLLGELDALQDIAQHPFIGLALAPIAPRKVPIELAQGIELNFTLHMPIDCMLTIKIYAHEPKGLRFLGEHFIQSVELKKGNAQTAWVIPLDAKLFRFIGTFATVSIAAHEVVSGTLINVDDYYISFDNHYGKFQIEKVKHEFIHQQK